jgi:hypothetical protein
MKSMPNLFRPATRVRTAAASLLALSLLALSGCATHRIRVDYVGFEKAFADTSNRELLLNLARLQSHDPTYFFKLGQITSSYKMAATLSSTASYALQGTVPGGAAATGGGTPGLTYENDPVFQFIPVTDETNAQLLLKPIPPETFYILYQQGWRIDQLLRLMVDRIEVTQSTKTGCNVLIYRNVPPVVAGSGAAATVSDQPELSSYASFLRASAIAYGLQKHGYLVLRGVSTFLPVDASAESIVPTQAGTASAGPANASDAEKAAEKNFSYEKTPDGKVLIGQRMVTPRFYLIPPRTAMAKYEPATEIIAADLGADPRLKGLETGAALQTFLAAVSDGFTIEGDVSTPEQAAGPCPVGTEHVAAHLVLRSLIGVMAAAAQEQTPFDKLVESNQLIMKLKDEKEARRFNEAIPEIERLPIIRINWKHTGEAKLGTPTPPLTELTYRGVNYLVADPRDASIAEDEYWNRDVFRLISALTAQVTVDTSKYPVPDILQLRLQ